MVFEHSNLHTHTNSKRSKVSNESYQRRNILLCCDCVSFSLTLTHSHPNTLAPILIPFWWHFMLYIHYGNFRLSVLVTETHTIHNYLIRILSFGYSVCTIYVQRTVDSKSYIYPYPDNTYAFITQLNLLLLFIYSSLRFA